VWYNEGVALGYDEYGRWPQNMAVGRKKINRKWPNFKACYQEGKTIAHRLVVNVKDISLNERRVTQSLNGRQ